MALTQLTKIDGGGISTTSDYRVGVITATKFVGPIEGVVTGTLTGTATTAVNAQGLIGTPNITVGILTASSANFSGNVSIGGTLTYEDVTNIDSVGIITAQKDIHVGAGVSAVGVGTFGSLDIGGDIDVDGHTNLDNVSIAGVTTFASHAHFGNSDKIFFGSNDDLSIYSTGSNGFIDNDTGYLLVNTTSDLVLRANADVYLQPAQGENALKASANGSVDLYYDQNNHTTPKLRTSATGITIDGTAVAGALDISGDIDVDGHTNLDNVSIAGVSTFASDVAIGRSMYHVNDIDTSIGFPSNGIVRISGDNERVADFSGNYGGGGQVTFFKQVYVTGGTVNIAPTIASNTLPVITIRNASANHTVANFQNTNNASSIIQWNNYNNSSTAGNLIFRSFNSPNTEYARFTGAGNFNLLTDLDVDGHTNLDNLSVAGVSTFSSNVDVTGNGKFNKTGNCNVLIGSTNAGGAAIVLDGDSDGNGSGSDYAYIEHDTSGNLNIVATNPADSSQMIFNTGDGSEALRITSSGEVRIPTGSNSTSRLTFGGGINIYHDGNMKFENGTGYLKLQSNNNVYVDGAEIFFRNAGGTNRWKIDSSGHLLPGAVGSYNIGSTGAEVGNVYLADSKNVFFGSDQDAEIYHNGTSGFYLNNSTGNTYIRSGGGQILMRPSNSYDAIVAKTNEVELYYNQQNHSTPKLKTSATGITVDGEVAASQDYPNFRPTIDFNFAATKKLDPRIAYSRAGTASYYDEFGKFKFAADNEPRFDHDPDTRECKGLLIEESRTNIAPYTDLSQYGGYNFTSTANDAVAPDGTTTAAKIEHGGSGTSYLDHINNSISASSADSYTYSVWLKAPDDQPDGYYGCRIAVLHSTGGNIEPTVSLNKTWTRYSVTKTFSASDPGNLRVHLVMFRAAPGNTYDGKVIPSYVWAWGAQIEKGAFSTSYIPTAGATRGNESLEIDGEDFTDFSNATEGTVLSHITPLDNSLGNHSGTGGVVWSFDAGGGFGNGHYLSNANNSTAFGHSVVVGSSGQNTGGGTGNMTNGVPFKNATVFKKDDFIMATNGTLATADTSGNLPTVSKLVIGNNAWGNSLNAANIYFRRFVYYPKRLPNTQLVTLTS